MARRIYYVDTVLHHFGSTDRLKGLHAGLGGVELALWHAEDMTRLSRGDDLSARLVTPGIYLALGRDQDTYDFRKWWATWGVDWEENLDTDMAPFLNIRGADALEEPLEIYRSPHMLCHASEMTLLKLRVLLDLRAVQSARRAFRAKIPNEITDLVCGHLVGSIVAARPEIMRMGEEELGRLIVKMKGQVRWLYEGIGRRNPCFWYVMF